MNRILFIASFLLFPGGSLFSQADSLTKYLEIAAKNNPLVLQKYYEYQAALRKVPQVGGLPDPELSMGVFLSPMELVSGNQVADIRLMQMFPWFGVQKNARDEMSLMADAKYESFRNAKLQVYYDVQRTWYELQKNAQDILISEKNAEILRTLERLTLVNYATAGRDRNATSSSGTNMSAAGRNNSAGSSGMDNKGGGGSSQKPVTAVPEQMQGSSMGVQSGGSGLVDLYRIQIELGELENNIALLKNMQNTIAARFNSYLNRPTGSPVSLPESLIADSLEISLLNVSDSMVANSPMLGMLRYEQLSLESRNKMVQRMGFPMVGVGLNFSVISKNEMSVSEMNGKDMIMPMITVTLPIYRKKYQAMKSETELLESATAQGYEAAENTLQTEYFEALQLYEDAGRRMQLYENQSRLANKSLDILVKSYSASGTDLSEVLRMRQQTLDYESKKVEAIFDYNTSIAWLKRLATITLE